MTSTTTVRELPQGFRLDDGSHGDPGRGLGHAGEDWTDHPECVDPAIAAFCRAWNDALPDDERQMLMPYVERIVGTAAGPELDPTRKGLQRSALALLDRMIAVGAEQAGEGG